MKEARSRLNKIRKDRGFNKSGPGSTKGNPNVPSSKKASGKNPCCDCGLHDNWAGDKECQRPGAGLARKTSPVVAKQKPRQVRFTEARRADHLPEVSHEDEPTVAEVGKLHGLHEASVVSHDVFLACPLTKLCLQPPLQESIRLLHLPPRCRPWQMTNTWWGHLAPHATGLVLDLNGLMATRQSCATCHHHGLWIWLSLMTSMRASGLETAAWLHPADIGGFQHWSVAS